MIHDRRGTYLLHKFAACLLGLTRLHDSQAAAATARDHQRLPRRGQLA